MPSLIGSGEYGGTFAGIVTVAAVAVLVLALGWLPGANARKRGHPNAQAISVCGWIGLLVWPAWVVALVWSYTGPDRSAPAGGSGGPPAGARPVLPVGPGRAAGLNRAAREAAKKKSAAGRDFP